MDNPKNEIATAIKQATNVLVTVSNGPSLDQLAAAIGLTLVLNKLDKHASAVFSGEPPSALEFLKPEATLEKTTDSLRDFIIALDKSKADKLRYKVEDKVVKIFITPYRTSITQDDLIFSQGDFNVDLVLALGVSVREDLDQAITAHGRILHDATVATLTTRAGGNLGTLNWVDSQASSISEMIVALSDLLKSDLLDGQIATALLTGIVAETERFSNSKTTAATMNASAKLMAAGANQQLVATKLEAPPPVPVPVTEGLRASANEELAGAATDNGTLTIHHARGDDDGHAILPDPTKLSGRATNQSPGASDAEMAETADNFTERGESAEAAAQKSSPVSKIKPDPSRPPLKEAKPSSNSMPDYELVEPHEGRLMTSPPVIDGGDQHRSDLEGNDANNDPLKATRHPDVLLKHNASKARQTHEKLAYQAPAKKDASPEQERSRRAANTSKQNQPLDTTHSSQQFSTANESAASDLPGTDTPSSVMLTQGLPESGLPTKSSTGQLTAHDTSSEATARSPKLVQGEDETLADIEKALDSPHQQFPINNQPAKVGPFGSAGDVVAASQPGPSFAPEAAPNSRRDPAAVQSPNQAADGPAASESPSTENESIPPSVEEARLAVEQAAAQLEQPSPEPLVAIGASGRLDVSHDDETATQAAAPALEIDPSTGQINYGSNAIPAGSDQQALPNGPEPTVSTAAQSKEVSPADLPDVDVAAASGGGGSSLAVSPPPPTPPPLAMPVWAPPTVDKSPAGKN